jgi:hypothetical protein
MAFFFRWDRTNGFALVGGRKGCGATINITINIATIYYIISDRGIWRMELDIALLTVDLCSR